MKIDMKFDSFTTYTTHKQTIDENLPNNNLSKIRKKRNFTYINRTHCACSLVKREAWNPNKSYEIERYFVKRVREWKILNVDSCEIYGFHLIKNIVYRGSNERWTSHGKNNRMKTWQRCARTPRKWFSDGALDASDDVGVYICSMGPTGLDVIRRFRFVYPARRPHWKRSETIKQYTTAALPVSRWKHFENVLKTLENDWNQTSYQVNKRNLSISRSSCPRALLLGIWSNESFQIPPRLTRDTICETDGFHASNLIRDSSNEFESILYTRGDWSMSINRWSRTLNFYLLFLGKDVFYIKKNVTSRI